MENFKIKVGSELESKEVQELFFELDYDWNFSQGYFDLKKYPNIIRGHNTGEMTCSIESDGLYKECKEITLPELRDLVVLKRNSIDDANYIRPRDGKLYFVNSGQTRSYYMMDDEWTLTKWDEGQLQQQLKPIEKPMKEYLLKTEDGIYHYHNDSHDECPKYVEKIEIPEGSNIAVIEDSKVKFYSKYTSADLDHLGKDLIWMRPTLPEELPFIDDEPLLQTATGIDLDQVAKNNDLRERYFGESDEDYRYQLEHYIYRKNEWLNTPTPPLNDQYAEIEQVRQSAWRKQEGGSHYKNLKIQPMQYALENKLDYAQANAVKYVTRHANKNGKEDLLKAIHNIELMIEFYYGEPK